MNIEEMLERIDGMAVCQPVPLHEFDLAEQEKLDRTARGFVYDRRFGVFRVGWGAHEVFMAELQAWLGGHEDVFDAVGREDVGCPFSHLADEYIETDGTCYLSSVGTRVNTWSTGSMNRQEKMFFGRSYEFLYLE